MYMYIYIYACEYRHMLQHVHGYSRIANGIACGVCLRRILIGIRMRAAYCAFVYEHTVGGWVRACVRGGGCVTLHDE